MTTYIFQEVSVYGEKTAKCPKCGKYYKRKEKFWATINPWNVNKDGVMKSWDEVYQDVMNKRTKWLEEPIEPHNCKEKLPPEESNPLTVDDINNFVSYYKEKESEIIRLASQIRNIEQEIKAKASEILSGKTFDYMEYKHKDSNYLYEPRESKIGEGYKSIRVGINLINSLIMIMVTSLVLLLILKIFFLIKLDITKKN